MFHEPSELDLAEIRLEFRRLYNQIGEAGCLQVLYEICKSGEVLAEMLVEERKIRERDMDHG